MNGAGAKAFGERDYGKVMEAAKKAEALGAFRDRVAAMRGEWAEMAAAAESAEDGETRAARRNLGQLRRGMRTPVSPSL